MRTLLAGALLLLSQTLCAIEIDRLENVLHRQQAPFSYPLDIKVAKGEKSNASVMVCCHGYGSNNSLMDVIDSYRVVSDHLVAFNFPDHDITEQSDPKKVTFGTINELLPVLYVLKLIAVDGGEETVSIYGFSAGGGAVVNAIGVLNTGEYDAQLQAVGISTADKQTILKAIQNGVVLLDAPLKSVEECYAGKRKIPTDDVRIQNYRKNNMRPVDALQKWEGLTLSVVVFFQDPDEAVANRDDRLFAQRVRQYNPKGRNKILITDEGGHCGFHHSLWNAYHNLTADRQP